MSDASKSTLGLILVLFLLPVCSTSYALASSDHIWPYDNTDTRKPIDRDQRPVHTNSQKRIDLATASDEIDQIISNIRQVVLNDPRTIVIVSMSGVLFIPTDKEFFVRDKSYRSLWQRALSSTKESKMPYIEEVIFTKYQHKSVDQRMVEFVSEMIDKGIRVIIVTANCSGQFNDIPNLEEWTVDWLKQRGIDLGKSVYSRTKFVMNKYSSKRNGSYPTFYKGLLSCSTDNVYNVPHSVIATLFVTMNERPTSVVMIYNNKDIRRITEQQIKQINDAVQFFGYSLSQTLERIIPEDYASDVTPKGYFNFWQHFSKELNAVVRSNIKNSDQVDPYEEN